MVRRTPRKLKKTSKLWLFCEGKTEKLYFLNLRAIERVRLKIIPEEAGVSRADQILDKAINFSNGCFKINNEKYDKKRDIIACLFDRDDNNTVEVFDKIRSACGNIMLGYSNPSFEYWILCHQGFYNSTSYNQKDVYDLVKDRMNINTKKEKDLYEKTKGKIIDARINSIRIKKIHEKNNTELISRDSTPLTLVYEIIDVISKFK